MRSLRPGRFADQPESVSSSPQRTAWSRFGSRGTSAARVARARSMLSGAPASARSAGRTKRTKVT